MFVCKDVDPSYIYTAPIQIKNQVLINAPREEVFKVLVDVESWPKWFSDMTDARWSSRDTHCLNSTRVLTLKGAIKIHEKFITWKENERLAFNFISTSIPMAHAFVEDFKLENEANNTTRLTYSAGYDACIFLKLTGPLGKWALNFQFKNAAKSLARYMESTPLTTSL